MQNKIPMHQLWHCGTHICKVLFHKPMFLLPTLWTTQITSFTSIQIYNTKKNLLNKSFRIISSNGKDVFWSRFANVVCSLKAEIFQVIRRFEWQVSFFLSSNLTSNCPEFELLCTVKRHMCVQKKSNTRSSHNITIYVFVKRECVQLSFLYRFLLIFNFLQEKIIKYTRWSSAVVLIHLEDRKKEKKDALWLNIMIVNEIITAITVLKVVET